MLPGSQNLLSYVVFLPRKDKVRGKYIKKERACPKTSLFSVIPVQLNYCPKRSSSVWAKSLRNFEPCLHCRSIFHFNRWLMLLESSFLGSKTCPRRLVNGDDASPLIEAQYILVVAGPCPKNVDYHYLKCEGQSKLPSIPKPRVPYFVRM